MTRHTIATISRAAFTSTFRAAGFRRQGVHLHRAAADLHHGIHFQASKWGTRSEGRFTMNLVVTAPFVYEAWTGRPFPANPATAFFPIQMRIGFLMPAGTDHWWDVTDAPPGEAMLAEVIDALTKFGVPFLDGFPSSLTLLQRLRAGERLPGVLGQQPPLVHAILAHHHGAIDEARALLDGALDRAGSSPSQATVRTLARRLGLEASASGDT